VVLIQTKSTKGSGALVSDSVGGTSITPMMVTWVHLYGEGGTTSCRRFRVLGILTVEGRQVDCQATIIAEAFEVMVLPFLLVSLPSALITRVV